MEKLNIKESNINSQTPETRWFDKNKVKVVLIILEKIAAFAIDLYLSRTTSKALDTTAIPDIGSTKPANNVYLSSPSILR